MLLSFRVANHKSIRDEQELLLLPAYAKDRPATTVAAIYGANASGKSNVLDGLGFMREAVLNSFRSWDPLGGVPRRAFALSSEGRQRESFFAVDLLLDHEKYVYGFVVDDARVREEWLYHYPRGRRRVLFERQQDDIKFGDSLKGPRATVEEITRPNSLFLSAAAQHSLHQVDPVYWWFDKQVGSYSRQRGQRRTRTLLTESPERAERVTSLLRAADLGIVDIRIEENTGPIPLLSTLGSVGTGKTAARISTLRRLLELSERSRGLTPVEQSEQPTTAHQSPGFRGVDESWGVTLDLWASPVQFLHQGSSDPTAIDFDDESQGTRTWFSYLGPIIDALDTGGTLLVDEIDSSLHPLVQRAFLRLFQDPQTNPNGAQLICTTHDSSLLGRHQGEELLRRDEIWFTEKDREGATSLFPLTDFQPRDGLNWERRYLGGSVGAVPFVDEDELLQAAVSTGQRQDG